MFFRKKEPLKLFRRDNLYIGVAGNKGRGLFCADDIAKGETIEVAPVMVFNAEETGFLGKTRFGDYVFAAATLPGKYLKRENIRTPRASDAIMMGAAACCNFARDANAGTAFTDEYHTGFYTLKARRDIPKGTEITLDAALSRRAAP